MVLLIIGQETSSKRGELSEQSEIKRTANPDKRKKLEREWICKSLNRVVEFLHLFGNRHQSDNKPTKQAER